MLNVPSSPSVRYEAVAGTLDEAVRRQFLAGALHRVDTARRARPDVAHLESACVLMGGIQ